MIFRQNLGTVLIWAGGIGFGLLLAGMVGNRWVEWFLIMLCMAITVEGQWQVRRASGTLRGTEMAIWHKYVPPPPSNQDTIGFLAQGRKPIRKRRKNNGTKM